MIRQNQLISAMSTRRCIATTWRLHHVKFHNNAQSQSNLEQKTSTKTPCSLVGRAPPGSQNMKQLESGDFSSIQSKIMEDVKGTGLFLHTDTFTREKIFTNDPTLYEAKNIKIKDLLEKPEARFRNLKMAQQSLEMAYQSLEIRTRELEKKSQRRHAGEVVFMRDQLARTVLSHEENKQRKQQVHDPKDIKVMKKIQDWLPQETDLNTTFEQMTVHPDQFGICSITIFGETRNNIEELLTWDKDGKGEVYNIFNERGEAWHNQFANTCIEPFNKWLSAIYALKETQSAMLENPSSHFETHIQKQKDRIKEAIREWNETFKMDKSRRAERREACCELIRKDYRDRGVMDHVRATLLHGVVLVKESENSKKIEENTKNEETKKIEESNKNQESKKNEEGKGEKTKKEEK